MDILFGNEIELLSLYQTKNLNEAIGLVQDDCEDGVIDERLEGINCH